MKEPLYYVIDGYVVGEVVDLRPMSSNYSNQPSDYSRLQILIELKNRDKIRVYYHDIYIRDKSFTDHLLIDDKEYTANQPAGLDITDLSDKAYNYDTCVVCTLTGEAVLFNSSYTEDITKRVMNFSKKFNPNTIMALNVLDVNHRQVVCFLDSVYRPAILKLTTNLKKNILNIQYVLANFLIDGMYDYIPNPHTLLHNLGEGSVSLFINNFYHISIDGHIFGPAAVPQKIAQLCQAMMNVGIPIFDGFRFKFDRVQQHQYMNLIKNITYTHKYDPVSITWTDRSTGKKCVNPFLPLIMAYYGEGASLSDMMTAVTSDKVDSLETRKIHI